MSMDYLTDPTDWLKTKRLAISAGLEEGDKEEFDLAIKILEDATNFAFARDNDEREFFKKHLLSACLEMVEL